MRAAIAGILGFLMVAACTSSSPSDDSTCTNNDGYCTTGSCSNELPYTCNTGGICCKQTSSSATSSVGARLEHTP